MRNVLLRESSSLGESVRVVLQLFVWLLNVHVALRFVDLVFVLFVAVWLHKLLVQNAACICVMLLEVFVVDDLLLFELEVQNGAHVACLLFQNCNLEVLRVDELVVVEVDVRPFGHLVGDHLRQLLQTGFIRSVFLDFLQLQHLHQFLLQKFKFAPQQVRSYCCSVDDWHEDLFIVFLVEQIAIPLGVCFVEVYVLGT